MGSIGVVELAQGLDSGRDQTWGDDYLGKD